MRFTLNVSAVRFMQSSSLYTDWCLRSEDIYYGFNSDISCGRSTFLFELMFTVKVVSSRLGIQQLIAFTKPTNKSRQIPITIDGKQSTEAK